ncbi:unnamed protein product [Polarella glacialis]|uniref:Palmitoyltransferase n=1 Tax=Polarella glacialis TaxID=89957 RepID=A0A813FYK1_POLGL|nr:unnamed protein product [Polarella glacialis]CAE8717391.1 unnamed protein product [Polarella glacialis]
MFVVALPQLELLFQPILRRLPAILWLVYSSVYITVSYNSIFAWFRVPAHSSRSFLPLSDLGLLLWTSYTLSMSAMGVAHIAAMASNAGVIVPPAVAPAEAVSPRYCEHCPGRSWKPARAHHCRECDQCVFLRHHHCILIQNCVGWGNQKVFLVFLLYAAQALIFSAVLLVMAVCCWLWATWEEGPTLRLVPTLCCLLAASCTSWGLRSVQEEVEEQWHSLRSNRTPIEQQREFFGLQEASFQEFWAVRLQQILGKNRWLWLLPVPSGTAPDFMDKVYHVHPIMGLLMEASSSVLDQFQERPCLGGSKACRTPAGLPRLAGTARVGGGLGGRPQQHQQHHQQQQPSFPKKMPDMENERVELLTASFGR